MRVRVPASSANLGPGFDCFGLAWQLYDEIDFTPCDELLYISGCDVKYQNENNLAYKAYKTTLEEYGVKPEPLHIDFGTTNIPVSRGLGSSSALIVGGVLAANELHSLGMSREDMLYVATKLEGHPDNVAPALYGGLTVSILADDKPVVAHFPLSDKLYFTVLIPPFELSTALSRSVLPDMLTRQDAIFNVAHAALLLNALGSGDTNLLSVAMEDKIHQPYRKKLIDGFDLARDAALSCGAAAMCISGAGSTLLCISGSDDFGRTMAEKMAVLLPQWRVESVEPEYSGARTVK